MLTGWIDFLNSPSPGRFLKAPWNHHRTVCSAYPCSAGLPCSLFRRHAPACLPVSNPALQAEDQVPASSAPEGKGPRSSFPGPVPRYPGGSCCSGTGRKTDLLLPVSATAADHPGLALCGQCCGPSCFHCGWKGAFSRFLALGYGTKPASLPSFVSCFQPWARMRRLSSVFHLVPRIIVNQSSRNCQVTFE